MAWVWLALLNGVLKGARDIVKKKAMQKSGMLDVLLTYTVLSLLLALPSSGDALQVAPAELGGTAVKSFVIFIGWMCGFYALERMPVSLFGILDLSQMLFTTTLSMIFLGERMTPVQLAGFVLVTGGLLMLKGRGKGASGQKEPVAALVLAAALICSLFNAVSGTLDKVLMRSMTSTQLQFWYLFFLSAWYTLYMLVRKIRFDWRGALKNHWIWILSILFVIADRALFTANGMADSRVTIMTLLKQSSCVVAIIGGRLVFHEKNIGYKLVCAAVVIAGIFIAVL